MDIYHSVYELNYIEQVWNNLIEGMVLQSRIRSLQNNVLNNNDLFNDKHIRKIQKTTMKAQSKL